MPRIPASAHGLPAALPSVPHEPSAPIQQSTSPAAMSTDADAQRLARLEHVRRARLAYFMRREETIADKQMDRILRNRRDDIAAELNALERPENLVPRYNQAIASAIGYLFRSATDCSPIQGPELENEYLPLQDSLEETRLLIKRGNVITDIEATNHKATWQTETARFLHFPKYPSTRVEAVKTWASSAVLLGAGNCGENAATMLAVHGQHLRPGQTHEYASARDGDHAFTIFRGNETFVADAWAEGPVVKPEHSESASSPGDTTAFIKLNHQSGPEFAAGVEQRRQELDSNSAVQALIKYKMRYYETIQFKEQKPYAPTAVLSEEFLDRTSKRMNGHEPKENFVPSDLRNEIRAAHIWRDLGAGVASSAKYAPFAVDEARKMDPETPEDPTR